MSTTMSLIFGVVCLVIGAFFLFAYLDTFRDKSKDLKVKEPKVEKSSEEEVSKVNKKEFITILLVVSVIAYLLGSRKRDH